MNAFTAKITETFYRLCEDSKPNLVLNDSFLFILERPGLSLDLCTAVLRPDTWKDPGKLKFT